MIILKMNVDAAKYNGHKQMYAIILVEAITSFALIFTSDSLRALIHFYSV